MRLAELDASFVKVVNEGGTIIRDVPFAEAEGVRFLCPVCFQKNGGPKGTHTVYCWFYGVPAHVSPGPGRWHPSGTGLEDLTFVRTRPDELISVKVGGCGAHFFVQAGGINFS